MKNWKGIVIHHSATADNQTLKDFDAIKKYHKEHNGWADIGYHFIIEKIGGEYKTLEGRNLEQTGAHALGFNSTHIGICCVGNFDKDTPSEKLYATTRALIDTLQEKYNIKSKDIIGHRDTYVLLGKPIEKTCPGKNFEIAKILS